MGLILLTEENKSAFLSYVPSYLHAELSEPESVSIGTFDDDSGIATGVLVGNVFNNWVEILWVYVAEEYREHGLARSMLRELIAHAGDVRDIDGITAQLGDKDAHMPLYNLLRSELFVFRNEEDSIYTLTVSMLTGNPFWSDAAHKGGSEVMSLKDLPTYILDSFEKNIAALPEGVPVSRPVPWDDCDLNFSVGYLKEDKMKGLLLIAREDEDMELSFAYADPEEKLALAAMLRASGNKVIESMPPETMISLTALNSASAAIVEKLFPDIERRTVLRAIRPFGVRGDMQ
ncbi:MAG: GNAT family N-acetyltransferase [Clostridiales Family XIII bacterium]|jgi:GNAT superfamily N-acetyltransferase|nr:GNAT family N-acetyltransferase [Clostridiales Family XIII bacterium]